MAEGDPLFSTLDEALESCEEALLRSAAELSREDLRGLSRHPSFYAAARRSRHWSHRALRGGGDRDDDDGGVLQLLDARVAPFLLTHLNTQPNPTDPTGSRRDRLVEAEGALDLVSILADYLEVSAAAGGGESEGGEGQEPEENVGAVLAQFFEEKEFHAGAALFRAGAASDFLFFIRKGVVELQVPPPPPSPASASASTTAGTAPPPQQRRPHRLMKVSDGGSVGELGFFLKRPQAFSAVATTRCLTYALSRPGLLALARARPQLCCLLQQAVIRSLSLSSSYAIADFNGEVNGLV